MMLIQCLPELWRGHRTHPPVLTDPPEPSISEAVACSTHFLTPENLSLDGSTTVTYRADIYRVLVWFIWNSMTIDEGWHNDKYYP